MAPKPPLLFLLLPLLLTTLPSSSSLPTTTSSFHTLLSLSHSLLTRVANLRAARGDISGSARARTIAHTIHKHTRGFAFYRFICSIAWDYFKNYSWRSASFELFSVVADFKELLSVLAEFESQGDRVEWVRRNYGRLLKVAKSLLSRLLTVFSQQGPLKDAVEMVRTEIVDGGLLRDCLELGSTDLKGVIQILKDLTSQYATSSNSRTEL